MEITSKNEDGLSFLFQQLHLILYRKWFLCYHNHAENILSTEDEWVGR